ncbi:VCBS repeat-containing protein [Streptomyces sp. NBC_00102]|uniref:FG-GAP repeat domain-containing protein n=1 Tax=Streptomyces sp. NBC_00102 TaxID=2975652 RepID=UPI002257DC47|nr:VCBS repeat-containing protein [Streptomyces sp. NBC_00102]MCX5400709.1 VCBS repeat-containing protein [Streptomyces sp. NBC_00102]
MRSLHSRRGVQLASALVAAGLCLSIAPQALAADDGDGVLKLTAAQAQRLTADVALDPYGDAAENQVSPQAEDAPTSGDSTDTKPSGSGSSLDGASTDAATDAAAPVTFTGTSSLEGVRGMGATVPVGKDGDYFTVHSRGNVQLHSADGESVWERTNTSYYADWQVKPLRPWQTEPYPVRIMMGYNAVSPFTPSSDSGYSTGDLTGDGVDDIVFSASVGIASYRPFTSPGSSLPNGTFVTVLDGKTGKTVWSKLYDYATMVKIVDGTLLVADAPRMNMNSPASDTAKLYGIRFSSADGKLTPSSTWTYDTGETGDAAWGDIQDLGKGKVAVSWDRAMTSTVEGRGHTLALNVADGSVTWKTDSLLYSRQLRVDAGRKRLVAVEQSDVNDAVTYEIAAYDLKTGNRTTLDSRVNVLPTALTVGDLTAKAGDEYAVAESSLDNYLQVNANTVRVVNGDAPGKLLWSQTTKRDAENNQDGPNVWRLQVADGKLVVAGDDDRMISGSQNAGGERFAATTVYSGKGALVWQNKGLAGAPMYQDVFSDAEGTHVRVIDQSQNIRTFKLGNGKQQSITPLQADISYAQTADVNKDGKSDVVMAGSSDGVWAYSGPSLVSGKPEKLWRATVPGSVHDMQKGDVNGDGKDEIVVAADSAVVVLNAKTGKTLATIDSGGQFVHSVELADLDGDGEKDIVVPTNTLNAYYGDGHKIWSHAAPAAAGDVIFSDASVQDGKVYASYSKVDSLDLADPGATAVALNAKTGKTKWSLAPEAPAVSTDGIIHAALTYKGTFASPEIPYADGHAVVYTWEITSQAGVGSTDATGPHTYMEIRDGRTGEVVHSTTMGGLWTHGGFFTDDGSLYQAGTSTFRRYSGEGTEDALASVIGQTYNGAFATGPGGRKLLIAGSEGAISAYAGDADFFESGQSFQSTLGDADLIGARNFLAADLDGDGTDEVLSLQGDDYAPDRLAEDLGGRYLVDDNGIHQVATYKLS